MEKVTNVICTICNNFGHVAMNYRRRTGRGNAGPWRVSGMTCYHCHKSGCMAKFCREKKNKLVNHSKDQKGKHKVDVEETRAEMNKIWKKKSDDKLVEESIPSPSAENPALVY